MASLHTRLQAAICVPTTRCLWVPADAITFVPALLTKTYGDGLGLFGLATINQRPAFYVVRGDSRWSPQPYYDRREPIADFSDHLDDIYDALEEEFGRMRCGYSGNNLSYPAAERVHNCQCEDCVDSEYVESWPSVDTENGSAWWRMDWPTVEYKITVKP